MKNQDQLEEICHRIGRILSDLEYAAMDLMGISAENGPAAEYLLQAASIIEQVLDDLDNR